MSALSRIEDRPVSDSMRLSALSNVSIGPVKERSSRRRLRAVSKSFDVQAPKYVSTMSRGLELGTALLPRDGSGVAGLNVRSRPAPGYGHPSTLCDPNAGPWRYAP